MAHVEWDFPNQRKEGNLQLKFFQYSNSKKVKIQPDDVEYTEE